MNDARHGFSVLDYERSPAKTGDQFRLGIVTWSLRMTLITEVDPGCVTAADHRVEDLKGRCLQRGRSSYLIEVRSRMGAPTL